MVRMLSSRELTGFRFLDYEVNLPRLELSCRGTPVHLDPKPFEVLVYLIRNRSRVVEPAELQREIWGLRAMSPSGIPTAVLAVRKALNDDTREPKFILTQPRRGYRFIAEAVELTPGPEQAFLGRDGEISRLEASLASAQRGIGQLVAVAGPAGIGKTRLIEEFLFGLGPADAMVARGHPSDSRAETPLSPWLRLLDDLERRLERRACDELFRDVSEMRAALESAGSRPHSPSDTPTLVSQSAFFDSMANLIARIATDNPLILFIDDSHQLDPTSTQLLERVAASVRRTRLLLLIATRSVKAAPWIPERAETLIELAPLARSSQQTLLTAIAPGLDCGTQERILERAEGNPLFLTQLARYVVDSNADRDRAARDALPSRIQAVVSSQLELLASDVRQILGLASVIGREFDVHTLSQVAGEDAASVVDALEPAITHHLIGPSEVGRLVFRHSLVRDAIYEQLPARQRMAHHFRIADFLSRAFREDSVDRATGIAEHYVAAAPIGGARQAIRFLRPAIELATQQFALEEARNLARRAEALAPLCTDLSQLQRTEILVDLAEAELRCGNRHESAIQLSKAFQVARHRGFADLLARIALAAAPGFFALEVGVVDWKLVEIVDSALQAKPPIPTSARAKLLARQAMALTYADRAPPQVEGVREAVRLALLDGDTQTLALAQTAEIVSSWSPEEPACRLQKARTAQGLAIDAEDLELAQVLSLLQTTDLMQLGRIVEADQEIGRFHSLAAQSHVPQGPWYCSLLQGMRRHMEGKLNSASRTLALVRTEGTAVGDRNATLSATLMSALLMVEQNLFRDALPAIDAVRAEFPAIDTAWRTASAYGLAQSLALGEARLQIAHVSPREVRRDVLWVAAMASLGMASALTGTTHLCEEIYRRLAPCASQNIVVGYSSACLGPVDRALALLAAAMGDWDVANGHFERAIRTAEDQGAHLWLAHTLHQSARSLLAEDRRRNRARAETSLERAHSLARWLGLGNLQMHLKRARTGIDPCPGSIAYAS